MVARSKVSFVHSTSSTPTKPSTQPTHCIAVTRSPSSTPTKQAETSGWSPAMTAATPAGKPWSMATYTPPM